VLVPRSPRPATKRKGREKERASKGFRNHLDAKVVFSRAPAVKKKKRENRGRGGRRRRAQGLQFRFDAIPRVHVLFVSLISTQPNKRGKKKRGGQKKGD